ncbi:MAG: hypothetical protein HWN66_18930 [Candidatus Helarchaeota archaeon]|nr:hypothetical protein [Candidatus Helarchaeota archaeon]
MKDEITLVKKFHEMIAQKKERENQPYWLKGVHSHVNLASKGFRCIWSSWWKGETPPKLEVDMIFVFEDIKKAIDSALIIGTEIKFFRDISKRNFYEGLQQVMAFAVFGFDGLALWHLFPEEVNDKLIENYAQATQEIINGFDLPMFYLAAKVTGQFKFKCFAPAQISQYDLDALVSWTGNSCSEKRNPLLFAEVPLGPGSGEIKKRRNTLKVMLKIPA